LANAIWLVHAVPISERQAAAQMAGKLFISLMSKSKVKFNRFRMNQGQVSPFGHNVKNRVGANPLFESFAELANRDLSKALDEFDAAQSNAVKNGTENTALKNSAMEKVLDWLSVIAKNVDIVANGDEAIILAAGFEVQKTRSRYEGDPGVVTGLAVEATLVAGEVVCKWVKGDHCEKTAFEWEAEDKPGEWHNGNYANGSKLLIKGLPSRTTVRIRARSLGSLNRKSPWCEPVPVFVY
jgi:hypothetical protein